MSAGKAPIYISDHEVKDLVSILDIITIVGNALELYSAGEEEGGVVQPVRTAVPVKDNEGILLTMPAYSQSSGSLGSKLLTLYSRNGEKGLPSHQAINLVFDSKNGSLLALVEGEELTAMRTSAASANAIKALVPKPPKVLCVVGTGNEARSHVHACRAVHDYEEVRIWGRNKKKAEQCAEDVGGGALVFESLEDAVKDADVVVTVTLATEPVLFGKWLKPGVVICCVGGCRPQWRELDDEIMQNAVVTVDTRDGAMKESGDIILSKSMIYAEIGELMSGSKPKPTIPDCGKKYYMFKSLGMAVEDVVSARLVYDRYKEKH